MKSLLDRFDDNDYPVWPDSTHDLIALAAAELEAAVWSSGLLGPTRIAGDVQPLHCILGLYAWSWAARSGILDDDTTDG